MEEDKGLNAPLSSQGGYRDPLVRDDRSICISDVVERFKSWTTHSYINGVLEKGWRAFNKRFWHRNYYEHIIRNDSELNTIREYILNNPIRWREDEFFAY